MKSISGTLGNYEGSCVVTSVCLNTNQNCYGPYGNKSGNKFSYDGEGGVIVGFFGLANKYVTAIGVHVMPESLVSDLKSTYEGKINPEVFVGFSILFFLVSKCCVYSFIICFYMLVKVYLLFCSS